MIRNGKKSLSATNLEVKNIFPTNLLVYDKKVNISAKICPTAEMCYFLQSFYVNCVNFPLQQIRLNE